MVLLSRQHLLDLVGDLNLRPHEYKARSEHFTMYTVQSNMYIIPY